MTNVTYVGDNSNNLIALARKLDDLHGYDGALTAFCKGIKDHPPILYATAITQTVETLYSVSNVPEVTGTMCEVHLVSGAREIYLDIEPNGQVDCEDKLISFTVGDIVGKGSPKTKKDYVNLITSVRSNESPFIGLIFTIGERILSTLSEISPEYGYHSHVYHKGKRFTLRLTNGNRVIDIRFLIDNIYNGSLY